MKVDKVEWERKKRVRMSRGRETKISKRGEQPAIKEELSRWGV